MIQRLRPATSNVAAWIRDAAISINSALSRIDGNVATVTGNYTVKANDSAVLVNAAAPVTVTLIDCGAPNSRLVIKDIAGVAGTHAITVSGTIDGSPSATISTNYGSLSLMCDQGNNWWTI